VSVALKGCYNCKPSLYTDDMTRALWPGGSGQSRATPAVWPAARPARHGPCGQALQSESITDRHHIEREKSVSDYCDIE